MPTVAIGIPQNTIDYFEDGGDTPFTSMPNEKHLCIRTSDWGGMTIGLGFEEEFSILGKLSELTDEQCKPLVSASYKDYTLSGTGILKTFSTPKESFISKLKSEGKLCKWMFTASRPLFHSLPDDLLILIKK